MKTILEISILETQGNKNQIFEQLREKYSKMHRNVNIQLKENKNQPFLCIEYPSKQLFQENYNRDIPFYETFMQEALKVVKNFTKQPLLPIDTHSSDKKPPFLIVKYHTTEVDVLRRYYNFLFEVTEYIGGKYAHEEIMDGFIIFHEREIDFEQSLLDVYNPEEVIGFLKKNNFDNDMVIHLMSRIWERLKNEEKIPKNPEN